MLKLEVKTILLDSFSHNPLVVLEDNDKRHLSIIIGLFEAQSILLSLKNIKLPRPFTHDLTKKIIEELEGKPLRLEIIALRNNIYFAQLIIQFNGNLKYIDCRPSDGIALALRFSIPIFAHEDVMKKGSLVKVERERLRKGPIQKEEVQSFKQVLESLAPSEFWKRLKEG